MHRLLGILGLLGVSMGHADFRYYTATLDSTQIVPSAADLGLPASAATGLLELVVDDATGTFQIDIIMRGLQGNYRPCFLPQTICSGSHFHLASAGQQGATHIYNTRQNFWTNADGNNNPAPGQWTYSATGQLFLTDLTTALTNLDVENVYFNVHTDYMTTGEIRGQLIPRAIPEPGTWTLLILGAAAIGVPHLRRRAARTSSFRRPITG